MELSVLRSVLLTAGGLLFIWLVKRWGTGFGIRSVSDMTALPLVLLLLAVFSFVSLPVSNLVSRQAESAADAYGLKLMEAQKAPSPCTRSWRFPLLAI